MSLTLPSLILLLRVKHQRMEPHAELKTRTETSPRRGLETEFSRNLGFAPYPGPQSGRPASDQQGILPTRGNNVSPGAFPVRVPGAGRAVPGARRDRGRFWGQDLDPTAVSQGCPGSPQPPVPLCLSPALLQHQPREPGRALGCPLLGLSAGAGRGGRERRGKTDAADKLRLFCRRQERGDEREAPGGSGCAV